MRYLCSGFGANVTISSACAADLGESAAGAATLLGAGKTRIFIESERFT